MSSTSATVRHAALDAPLLLLAYGLLRLVDGLDDTHDPGLLWTFAHLALFASMALFAVLATAVRKLVPPGARTPAAVAASATVAGVVCFLWTVTGALSPGFGGATPLPGPLRIAGPLFFSLGLLTLLGLLVAARRAPAWSPLLFGAGVAAMIIDAGAVAPAALILLAALAPLARPADGDPARAASRPARADARLPHAIGGPTQAVGGPARAASRPARADARLPQAISGPTQAVGGPARAASSPTQAVISANGVGSGTSHARDRLSHLGSGLVPAGSPVRAGSDPLRTDGHPLRTDGHPLRTDGHPLRTPKAFGEGPRSLVGGAVGDTAPAGHLRPVTSLRPGRLH
ncbi:hypothetical protein [Actinoplanes subglobosus]|uniref:Uncharacterized protein n=1 Tax=Actinoplanes subglobosus TaxID=1547892 RepID=A0ABV8J0C7_9ACTN